MFQNKTDSIQEGEETFVRNQRVCAEHSQKEEGTEQVLKNYIHVSDWCVVVGKFFPHLLHYPMQELELEFLVFKGCILSTEFLKEMAYHMKEFMKGWGCSVKIDICECM